MIFLQLVSADLENIYNDKQMLHIWVQNMA